MLRVTENSFAISCNISNLKNKFIIVLDVGVIYILSFMKMNYDVKIKQVSFFIIKTYNFKRKTCFSTCGDIKLEK